MKYIIFCVGLIVSQDLCAMHGDNYSKAEQSRSLKRWIEESKQALKESEPDKKRGNSVKQLIATFNKKEQQSVHVKEQQSVQLEEHVVQESREQERLNPFEQEVQDCLIEQLRLIQSYSQRQLAKMNENYETSIKMLHEQSASRDIRIATMLDRQADTIIHLSDLVKRLISKSGALERNIGTQSQNLDVLREDTDRSMGRLLDTVGDQAELFMKQNAVIRELMRRVEMQTHKANNLARKQAIQAIAITKARKMIEELSSKYTMRELDELLQYFTHELAGTKKADDDDELMRQIFGRSTGDISNTNLPSDAERVAVPRQTDSQRKYGHLFEPVGSSEEEEIIVEELERETATKKTLHEMFPEDPKDVVRRSEQSAPRDSDSYEIIEDITIIEDLIPESNCNEA